MFLKKLFAGKQSKPTKILLAGIAKNEAAYLPEWLLHHLYFGLDHIDVFVNRTSDNTDEISRQFASNNQVSFINADHIFTEGAVNPQKVAYFSALKTASEREFSHVLFLDIDEFWTPKDLRSSIKELVQTSIDADSISFEWINKFKPERNFARAIEPQMRVIRAPQVKSLLKTRAKLPRGMNPHNVVDPSFKYKLANGENFVCDDNRMSRVQQHELSKPVKEAFIVHRPYRSQMEYIANLGKFNPEQQADNEVPIKSNRRKGYPAADDTEHLSFNQEAFERYDAFMHAQMSNYDDAIKRAQIFIQAEYERVLNIVAEANPLASKVIEASFKNIDLVDAKKALEQFRERTEAIS
ncbi:glycosyltransferase family 2 protein [Glaciecola siphonariae]|uniref:Glycosyltransferase family 2 protein n=1 Tax=Glaciecola siphonariae TaxID=521012 RepID=A0ABV9LSH9_9ALTE